MPIENEVKYVLKLDCEDKILGDRLEISQAYLFSCTGMSSRIRRIGDNYSYTFKLKKSSSKTIEIETSISKADFNDLWKKSKNQLRKTRYCSKINEFGEKWDIDFFGDKTYFALAECEMPEESIKPSSIPSWLKKHIIYEVPPGDCRFSSRKLSDVKYATKIYQNLSK